MERLSQQCKRGVMITKVYQHEFRACVPEAGIKGRDK